MIVQQQPLRDEFVHGGAGSEAGGECGGYTDESKEYFRLRSWFQRSCSQVQDDLKHLKERLLAQTRSGEVSSLDYSVLEDAIARTERGIKVRLQPQLLYITHTRLSAVAC